MKILSLVENTTKCDLEVKHGLSLYIETNTHKILFDVGPDETLFRNAKKRNINLADIDMVIISHGHHDHGGALKEFLNVNTKAKIYVQAKAFEPHYSMASGTKSSISLDASLMHHPQMVLLDGNYQIDENLFLFTVKDTHRCHSIANDVLLNNQGKDDFIHEQNLIIKDKCNVLIMGCGHTGIVNILEEAKAYHPKVCIGGFHLMIPRTHQTIPCEVLDEIATYLQGYPNMQFYTCHCTGEDAYAYLAKSLPNLSYFACGDYLEI